MSVKMKSMRIALTFAFLLIVGSLMRQAKQLSVPALSNRVRRMAV